MKRVLLKFIPLLIVSGVLQADDLIINFDNELKDHSIIKIEDKIKREVVEERLSFYKNKLNKKEDSIDNVKKVVPKDINYIITENQKISELLNKIGRNEGKVYILRDKDFLIKEGYKVNGMEDLIKLVRLVSTFNLVLTKTDIINTFYVNLKLKEDPKILTIEAEVNFNGLRNLLMNEYGIRTIITNDLITKRKKQKFKLFGTYTISELIKDFENQSNLWFNLKGTKLYINETREIIFDIKRDGEFSIDFTTQSSASTGSTEDATAASTGFSFKLEDYSAQKFLDTLSQNFPKIFFKKSYSGFVIAEVKPAQYDKVTNYFENIESRHQLITGEIVLLNLTTNDNFKYNFSWQDFLLNKNLLKIGSNGMLSLGAVSNVMGAKSEPTNTGFKLGINSKNGEVGFIEALSEIGEVSVVDKWTISTATGIPTGFTNYIKHPYYTSEAIQNQVGALPQPSEDSVNPAAFAAQSAIPKLNYALTGFKVTFRVNKTKESSYVIDGAIDYSGITSWKRDSRNNEAPELSGKSMRIYSELTKLDKTIVIGGFKNLENHDNSLRTPWFGSLPIIGWLFKNDDQKAKESEFILLIKLKSPQSYDQKEIIKKYKSLDRVFKTLELKKDSFEREIVDAFTY